MKCVSYCGVESVEFNEKVYLGFTYFEFQWRVGKFCSRCGYNI